MIWDFLSYRDYLLDLMGAEGSRTGMRKRLAEAIPVHTTFISQVLKGRVDFSLEQAESISAFLGHTEDEGEYFLLLLLKERAGSQKLKERFLRKIQQMRDERSNIQKRLEADNTISLQDRERFYSSYIYAAIHVLVGIPKFKTVEALADALKLTRSQVQEIVEFLMRIGILKQENGKLSPGQAHVHLGNDSTLILKHHSNWRLHALNSLQFINKDDLHYSACMSITQENVFKIKESMLQNLKTNVETITQSAEEVAFVMNLDFYRLSP